MNVSPTHIWIALGLCCMLISCAECSAPDPQREPTPDAALADTDESDVSPSDILERDTSNVDVFEDVPDEDIEETFPPSPGEVVVEVRLDGVATPDVRVVQGGAHGSAWWTDAQGRARIQPDPSVEGELILLASHPEARIKGVKLNRERLASGEEGSTLQVIDIDRYQAGNPAYRFQHPGEPGARENTTKCGHCHQTINDSWYASPHRTSASNSHVLDLYSGASSWILTEEDCAQRGGQWRTGHSAGSQEPTARCYIGDSVLSDLNDSCNGQPGQECEDSAQRFGYCASCHAPALRETQGRPSPMGANLLDAQDIAYEYGVSCDVCHKVAAVDSTSDLPGISGRLQLALPSEPASPSIGPFLPLTFGPSHDVPNPRMGSVQRDHYRNGQLCSGCHQHEQPALLTGQSLDPNRWPSGTLPIQSTWEEWSQGPMRDIAPCVSCHMPPDPSVSNGGDLQLYPLATVGIQGGWHRPPGSVRTHSWIGPRQPASRMLELAASVDVSGERQGDDITLRATVRNVGPGHFIPTGEPSRAIFVRVEARCGTQNLQPTGGAVVPSWGGALAQKSSGEDWSTWPNARVGDVVRVVDILDTFYDYDGFGPFSAQGRFTPPQKGMPIEEHRGTSTITHIDPQGRATFDPPLPSGDIAIHARDGVLRTGSAFPHAGAPGFAFARVTADSQGRPMVPHHKATDILSDNRLGVGKAWTSTHTFSGADTCNSDPVEIRAVVLYRPHAWDTAHTKAWTLEDRIMTTSTRVLNASTSGGE